MWNLKCDPDELIYETETDSHRKQTGHCPKGGRAGEVKDWEFGISRRKLLYIGWIKNKVLLYSTGNYIQYPVANHNGKEYRNRKEKKSLLLLVGKPMCSTSHIVLQRIQNVMS